MMSVARQFYWLASHFMTLVFFEMFPESHRSSLRLDPVAIMFRAVHLGIYSMSFRWF